MFSVAVVLNILLLAQGAPDSSALPGYSVPITIADSGARRFTITFGVDARATYGFDLQLGERPIPPPPDVAAFDIRFLDPYGRKTPFAGNGSYTDIRPYRSRSQVDTFYVRFQPRDLAYPMVISWPQQIREAVDSAFVTIYTGEEAQRINMIQHQTIRVTDTTVKTCTLVVYGIRPAALKQ